MSVTLILLLIFYFFVSLQVGLVRSSVTMNPDLLMTFSKILIVILLSMRLLNPHQNTLDGKLFSVLSLFKMTPNFYSGITNRSSPQKHFKIVPSTLDFSLVTKTDDYQVFTCKLYILIQSLFEILDLFFKNHIHLCELSLSVFCVISRNRVQKRKREIKQRNDC